MLSSCGITPLLQQSDVDALHSAVVFSFSLGDFPGWRKKSFTTLPTPGTPPCWQLAGTDPLLNSAQESGRASPARSRTLRSTRIVVPFVHKLVKAGKKVKVVAAVAPAAIAAGAHFKLWYMCSLWSHFFFCIWVFPFFSQQD